VGLLLTANALAQMIAAPTIGRLSDRWGRRSMLIISVAGTVAAFLLFSFANSLAMLFISRILDGLLGGNTALARAYITDITDEENRSKGLGLIGAAFGLGFIIGPFSGGQLSRFGYMVPGLVAAGLSLINLLAVLLWIPESLTEEQKETARKSAYTRFSMQNLLDTLKIPCVGQLLSVNTWFSLAFMLFQVNFVLVAKESLALSAQTTSLLLSLVGVMSVITQGLIVGWISKRVRETKLMFTTTIVLMFALIGWGFAKSIWQYILLIIPIAISAGIFNVSLTSLLTKSIYRENVGGTLGLAQSQQTFAQVITPLMGGPLIQYFGGYAVGLTAAFFLGISAMIEKKQLLGMPEAQGPCSRAEAVNKT
jgi:MFS transporter, DHA1 family, tetracycline resistance protein